MLSELRSRLTRSVTGDREGLATIGPRTVYILPTRQGAAFALLVLIMLIGAINYANNLGFMLTFLLAGIGVAAMVNTWRNLVGLSLAAGRAEPVFAGQTACFQVRALNRQALERPGLEVGHARNATRGADLSGQAETTLSLSRQAAARGRLALGRIVVATRYPTGLFRAWSYVDLDASCLVYPTPGPRGIRVAAPEYDRSETGDKGVGADDFVGLRQYRPGDSPKHIDWKAVAREQGIHTKQFGGDRADRVWLDFDHYPGLDVESVLSLLCRAVLDASEAGNQFGLKVPGRVIQPASGTAHRDTCLTALALFGEAR